MVAVQIYLLLISGVYYVHAQKFTEESPYMLVRLMDVKLNEWKPEKLDQMEKILDAELKYSDDRKGIECKSIDFEQEAGYPVQDARFLDLSIRGLCKDFQGKVHPIDKALMIVAFERHIDEINAVTTGTVYRLGNVQLYKRNRNLLNYIIIPISVGFIIFIFVLTFLLRHIRRSQKQRFMVAELKKKQEATEKKTGTVPNTDPYATDKEHLITSESAVAGSATNTLGSPKEFTNDQHPNLSRTTTSGNGNNQGSRKSQTPPQDSSVLYNNQNREKSQMPFNDDVKLLPSQCQPQYDPTYKNMIPLQETQPRVIVRSVRGDETQPSHQPPVAEQVKKFVQIPVQVERSGGSNQSYVPPPYHSDPYYRPVNP